MPLGSRAGDKKVRDRNLIFGVLAAVIALIGASLTWILGADDEVKSADCSDSNHLAGHTIVVLDRTDRLTSNQQRYIVARMRRLVGVNSDGDVVQGEGALGAGERLTVFEVSPGEFGELSDPILSICRPRDGSKASELYENGRLIERRFEQRFLKPFEAFLSTIKGGGLQESPILETLFDIAARDDFNAEVLNRRLLIFSDMLQHNENLSFYRAVPPHDAWLTSSYGRHLQPKMGNVTVEIQTLLHLQDARGAQQDKALISFWAQYFDEASGPGSLRIEKIRD